MVALVGAMVIALPTVGAAYPEAVTKSASGPVSYSVKSSTIGALLDNPATRPSSPGICPAWCPAPA